MLDTRTLWGSCWEPPCRSSMGYLECFFPFLGWTSYLPSCGWPAGEGDARHASHPFLASVFPHWTHWKKGWGRGVEATPTHKATLRLWLLKHLSQAGPSWSWLQFQSFLALEKVLPEDADMITCFLLHPKDLFCSQNLPWKPAFFLSRDQGVCKCVVNLLIIPDCIFCV